MLVVPETDDKLHGIFMHPYIEPEDGSNCRWDAEASMAELVYFTGGHEWDFEETCTVCFVCKQPLCSMTLVFRLLGGPVWWTLNVREPITSFTNGKVAAIGDAAHPQLPCMSILMTLRCRY